MGVVPVDDSTVDVVYCVGLKEELPLREVEILIVLVSGITIVDGMKVEIPVLLVEIDNVDES